MTIHQRFLDVAVLGLLVLIAGCASPPVVQAPSATTVTAIVEPLPTPPVLAESKPEPPTEWPDELPPPDWRLGPSAANIAVAAALTPAGAQRYACVKTGAGGETRTTITLPPGTERICSRHPAMGPCQYERDQCRRSGGRVIRFDGIEITPEVEREYDKQVTRIRLNAG